MREFELRYKRAMRFRTAPSFRLVPLGVAAIAATVACSDSDSSDDPTPPQDAGFAADVGFIDSGIAGGQAVALDGTWASFRVSSQCFDGALGRDRVLFTWIAKHDVTQDGTSATMTTEICDLQLTDYQGSASSYPTEALSAFDVRDVDVVLGGTTVGASFVTQPQAILLGWTPTGDPLTEELPQDDTDARLVDADNDGNPGVSLVVTGFVSGSVYIANRNLVTVTGVIVEQDKITGTTMTTADQRIVGASAILLNNNSTTVTDDGNPDSSPFEMVRLSGDDTCANIVAMAAQLFTLTSTPTPTSCPS